MSIKNEKRGTWRTVSQLAPGMRIAVPAAPAAGAAVAWDEIVSITPVGREQVYDIEIEGTHNFVGNDIIAHNTYISSPALAGQSTTTPAVYIAPNGNVGIGVAVPNHTLDVAGDIAAISFVNTSTRTMKTGITYLTASSKDDMLGRMRELKVATYRYTIEDQADPLRLGLIAEDTQAIAPEVLSADGKGVDIYKLATFTLAGVQALADKVAGDETHIASLESRVAKLESGAISSASGSPIALSSSTLASALQGFGVLIDKGIAQFNTLVFRQLVASKDADGTSSAGSVTILAGNTVAQVANSLVAPSTKVFVTFNSEIAGSWWVADKTAGSFRVVLSQAQTADVSFDYFLVQTEGQIATSSPNTVLGSTNYELGGNANTGSAGAITVLGDNPLHVAVGAAFTDPGVNANGATVTTFINGIQQTVSSSTVSTASPTTYIITYQTTDASGAFISATRAVIVGNPDGTVSTTGSTTTTTTSTDTTAPTVTLNGAAAMQIYESQTFADPGATASDPDDATSSIKMTESGSVNTATIGSYTLTYSATDAAGNVGSASRLVTVVASSTAP